MQNKKRDNDDSVLFTSMKPLKHPWFAGLRFLENVYRETADLYPDTRKIQMMIFTGKNSKTIETFDEYMKEYGTPNLFEIKTWKK